MIYLGQTLPKLNSTHTNKEKIMAKLTVMVSMYQSGEWIENRIKNLLASSLKDIEIWCVNANSPDQRDDEIPQKYPVKYIKLPERITVYETWNYIIENSKSEFITNANTDDLIHPDGYHKLISTIEKNPQIGFIYPSWYTTALANQEWPKLREIDRSGRPGHYKGDLNKAGVGHFPLWRRSIHDQIGLFDIRYKALSDADFWARAYHISKQEFMWLDEYLGCYLWKNGENLWTKAISPEEWGIYHKMVQLYQSGLLK